MDNCTLCSDTLSGTEKQDFSMRTQASEPRFLTQYSSTKVGKFWPTNCRIYQQEKTGNFFAFLFPLLCW